MVMTARDEFTASWPDVETIEMGPLSDADLRELVTALPEGRKLSDQDVTTMITRSEGVPLYLEELVRAGPTEASGPKTEAGLESRFTVPPALLEPLLARLASPDVDLSLVASDGDDRPRGGRHPSATGHRAAGAGHSRAGRRPDRRPADRARRGDQPTFRFRHQLLGDVAYEMQL